MIKHVQSESYVMCVCNTRMFNVATRSTKTRFTTSGVPGSVTIYQVSLPPKARDFHRRADLRDCWLHSPFAVMLLRMAAACSALVPGARVSTWRAPLRGLHARAPTSASLSSSSSLHIIADDAAAALPSQWVVFSDLHVRQETLPVCLELLRQVEAAAHAHATSGRPAGVIFLGDFWHSGSMLSTRQLNLVLSALGGWCRSIPVLMIPGNHDQAMRGNPEPMLHALTPFELSLPNVQVYEPVSNKSRTSLEQVSPSSLAFKSHS